MTAPRPCTVCGELSDDTVSVVVSHRRAPIDGDDVCVACAAERGEECGEHRLPDCSLTVGHRGICWVAA